MEWTWLDLVRYRCKKLTDGEREVLINEMLGEGWYVRVWTDSPKERGAAPKLVEGLSVTGVIEWLNEREYRVCS